MTKCLLTFLLLIPYTTSNGNFSLSSNQKCKSLLDCPKGFANCSKVADLDDKRCIKDVREICLGGIPRNPVKSCNRSRDCYGKSMNSGGYIRWCDMGTHFCCKVLSNSTEELMCPDRVTPLYGQDKCQDANETMIYSGRSRQNGGFCYKGYSCPPKITRPNDLTFGSRTFQTNMDCNANEEVDQKFDFMFCHNDTGNLWVMGQYNVNGDEVIKHWTHCNTNNDCGEGLVCVKEDLCRYRCYDDPTLAVNYGSIVAQILAMFFVPIIFLSALVVLTVKYLD
ncbi:hypothetical protein CRE_10126 [Caenorhabditis remanei]|uniref:Uncharacterized protein n=1 Tax=Caenorhabditis remanei TaxID=31234 RepID=E3M6C4_CAERE|nr:hypothetical protein CRE_10126 [Caenorhabditis remanei]